MNRSRHILSFENEGGSSNENFYSQSRFVRELKPSDFDLDTKVMSLKKEIMRGSLKETKNACYAIMFYCSWCPHCISVKTIWENFAKRAAFMDVYAINCAPEENKKFLDMQRLKNKNLISGYPTFIFYRDGKRPQKYEGERSEGALLANAMKICQTSSL